MIFLLVAAQFLVAIQPLHGGTGPVRVTIEAHDANTAKMLAQAQYRGYRVYDVRRIK